MKSKIGKLTIGILVIAVAVLAYKSPMVSAWRHFNNGMRAYGDSNFQQASAAFSKALKLYDEPAVQYNECISLWAALMKKQKDLKIESIADPELSEADRRNLLKSSQKARNKITDLIDSNTFKSDQSAALLYARGMLLLLENQPREANSAFRESISHKADFTPALKQLVQNQRSEMTPAAERLILATAETAPIELRNWKPF
ncbi:hypothetical protein GF337_13065 [candidate division KSB1 bacterium]|nr:hypothetical protein [candidate division KSB1 bacterium]